MFRRSTTAATVSWLGSSHCNCCQVVSPTAPLTSAPVGCPLAISTIAKSMADAEAHNASGSEAFKAGDFPRATELYFKAVEADGTVAKYRTNLSNALLKSGQ